MEKIATKVFIFASIAFGIVGLALVFFGEQSDSAVVNQVLMRALMACIFIILPSFALSVASKYLNGKS